MTRTLALALALAAAGCAHRSGATSTSTSATSASQPATASAPSHDMEGMCPMSVPGTQVSAADTATGVALTFTTTPDQVPALREKVAAMAEMHNRHRAAAAGGRGTGDHGSAAAGTAEAQGAMQGGAAGAEGSVQGSAGTGAQGDGAHAGVHGGMAGHGGMEGHRGMAGMDMPPPATARAEDLEGGARLVLTPDDPADLPKLQSTVRAHAEQMQKDGCGMMGHGRHG